MTSGSVNSAKVMHFDCIVDNGNVSHAVDPHSDIALAPLNQQVGISARLQQIEPNTMSILRLHQLVLCPTGLRP